MTWGFPHGRISPGNLPLKNKERERKTTEIMCGAECGFAESTVMLLTGWIGQVTTRLKRLTLTRDGISSCPL
jgi:hypothetical protein